MASITLTGLADRYAVGATVGAFPASGWLQSQLPPSGAPQGSATATSTIGSDGSVTLTGLADGTAYYLTETSGTRHYTSFATPAASGGAVTVSGGVDTELPAGLTGDATNGLDVDVTRVQGPVAMTAAAGSQADGHSASIGATADADTTNTVIGRLKKLVGIHKAEDSASADGDLGIPILVVRNDNDASLTSADGDYSMLAVDASGRIKLVSSGAPGSAVPARALQVGGSDGTNLRALKVASDGTIVLPATAKGTQGSTATPTQDLKDAGRSQVALAWADQAGTAGGESALANYGYASRAGAALGAANKLTVTTGKTLRIQEIRIAVRATSTVNNRANFRLRQDASASISNASPIIWLGQLALPLGTVAAGAYVELVIPIPDGLEVAGGQAITFTWSTDAATCEVGLSLTGYEY